MTDEPMTPTVEAMAQMHELFLSMLNGGFTEKQALYTIGVWMANTAGDAE